MIQLPPQFPPIDNNSQHTSPPAHIKSLAGRLAHSTNPSPSAASINNSCQPISSC
jgi:hypothetical protein